MAPIIPAGYARDNNPSFETVELDKLIVDKSRGSGVQVDTDSPSFAWRDLLGRISIRSAIGQQPQFNLYIGTIRQFQFAVNDECWVEFHIPHDYVPNSDVYLHTHWSLNVAGVSQNIVWGFDATYAKGHNQAAYHSPVNILTSSEPTSLTQYQHMLTEVQASGVGKINAADLEPDGLILVRVYLHSNSGATKPFLHFADLHYQSTSIGTKQKSPDFYV